MKKYREFHLCLSFYCKLPQPGQKILSVAVGYLPNKWVCWKGHTKSSIVGQTWPQLSGVKRADSRVVTTQAGEESSVRCERKNPTSLSSKDDE